MTTSGTKAIDGTLPQRNARSPQLARLLRRLRGADALVGIAIVLATFACLVGADWIARHDPYEVDLSIALKPPSEAHWMGTDQFGRDMFARIVHGARYSVLMGLIVVASSTVIGVLLGSLAGFFGGWLDELIMRITDLMMGFPPLLFAMLVSAVLGATLTNAIIAAAAIWWPSYVRLMRGQVLSTRNELYVEASRSIGATNGRLIWRHVFPNSWGPIIVRGTMDVGRAVIFVGALSFIGLGAQPPLPEWGTTLAEARSFIIGAWWYVTFPGLAIFLTVFSYVMTGEAMRDALDPRLKKRE